MGLIRWMTAKDPKDRPKLSEVIRHSEILLPIPTDKLKTFNEIKYSPDHVLGKGGQATVFIGYSQGSAVQIAVKRIANIDAISKTEKEKVYRELNNFKPLEHDNIVKLFGSTEDGPFL